MSSIQHEGLHHRSGGQTGGALYPVEKLGGKLTDEMWAAVPLKCISGPLKVHLNLSLNESSSYAKIREVIRAYDTATARLFRCNHHFIPFAASPRLYWYYAYEGGQDQGERVEAKGRRARMGKGSRRAKTRRARARTRTKHLGALRRLPHGHLHQRAVEKEIRKDPMRKARANPRPRRLEFATIVAVLDAWQRTAGGSGRLEVQTHLPQL